MADLWSDYTDMLIAGIDKQFSSKYKFSLRALLTDPTKYASQQNVQVTIDNMKEEADKYLDDRVTALGAEQKDFDDAAAKADSISGQLARSITMNAKQNNVPVITPVAVDRDMTREKRVYIDTIDSSVTMLIEKLAASSMLIANLSTTYKEYTFGSWLFSGNKDYVVSVFVPDSSLLMLEASRIELDGLLLSASSFIKGL
jgi:hypothetical protein